MHGDEGCRYPAGILQISHGTLGNREADPEGQRSIEHLAVMRTTTQMPQQAQCHQHRDPDDDAVDPGHPRDRQEREPPGLLVAGVRSRAGDDSSGKDGQRCPHNHQPNPVASPRHDRADPLRIIRLA